jgi:phospho-N-acetylmuramoyl-pentapeptide-transferase
VVVLISAANAVNLTDGLDGLASGLMVIACAAYALIAWKTGHNAAAVFAGALGGGCLGFLKYNYHPAVNTHTCYSNIAMNALYKSTLYGFHNLL